MIDQGLIVTGVTYHDKNKTKLNTFCIMWAQFMVKEMVLLPRRINDPEKMDVYEVKVFGVDSKVDYLTIMTNHDGLWRMEFYAAIQAV